MNACDDVCEGVGVKMRESDNQSEALKNLAKDNLCWIQFDKNAMIGFEKNRSNAANLKYFSNNSSGITNVCLPNVHEVVCLIYVFYPIICSYTQLR